MNLRLVFAPAIAALALSSGAMADPPKHRAAMEDNAASARTAASRPAAKHKLAAKADKPGKSQGEQVAAEKPLCVRAIGRPETGTAAWYGGRYVGRRTTSGERLDTVHATAAHRTLPLNSLARVTNLANGRTVVVRVTDRGPVSDSLLIDMSPRAADDLQMKEAGLARVMVEQVVEVPPDAK